MELANYYENLIYRYLFKNYHKNICVSMVVDKLTNYKLVDNLREDELNIIVTNAFSRVGLEVDDDEVWELIREYFYIGCENL